jgi:ABC-2 type transport system ATP-binding protein
MESAISVRGWSVGFRRKNVLDRLSLEVEPGTVFVLLGSNGAGKSTLLKSMLGLLPPREGSIRVLGLDPIRDARRVRQSVGYVPDVPDAYLWMTVPDLFRFLAPHHPRWSKARAADLVDVLSIPTDVKLRDLSRGQGMKAMLAAALAPDPDVLLLDEPFAGLDPIVREEVLRSVIGQLRDGRRTVVVATHELDAAARIADRVAVLSDGRIVKEGTLSEVVGSGEEEPTAAPSRLHAVLADVLATSSVGEGR